MTTTTITAADRFNLQALATFRVDGVRYVLYSDDGGFAEVVAAAYFDGDLADASEDDDYTAWCDRTGSESEDVYRAAARAWGRGFNSGAHGWIDCE